MVLDYAGSLITEREQQTNQARFTVPSDARSPGQGSSHSGNHLSVGIASVDFRPDRVIKLYLIGNLDSLGRPACL